jgi:NADH-quinone oxidoreductase subunit G
VLSRGEHSEIRTFLDRSVDSEISGNVIDICPVGALLSKPFLHKARVWYLKPTPSVCPGCERGCTVNIWHRKTEWQLRALDPKQNTSIARVTPLENPAVNGPWICNKGRDLAAIFERPRADQAMLKGKPIELDDAIAAARQLISKAKRAVALASTWGSNEELAAFKDGLATHFTIYLKRDHEAQSGERLEDELLIRPDKNPNAAGARALFGADRLCEPAFTADTDLVLVWGEGCNFAQLPAGAKIVFLNSYLQPENGHADVFIPVSIQTERAGHYTNFAGVVSGFERCFAKKPTVAHAQDVFTAMAAIPARQP